MIVLSELLMGERELARRPHFDTPFSPPCSSMNEHTATKTSHYPAYRQQSLRFQPRVFHPTEICQAYFLLRCLDNQVRSHGIKVSSQKQFVYYCVTSYYLSAFISPSRFCSNVSVAGLANAVWSHSSRREDIGALTNRVLR